jgi:hypothetical protein
MFTPLSPKRLVLELVATIAIAASAQDKSAPAMTLVVDETQGARRIAFVHEEIRVRAGAVTLAYPKWIPGQHGPTGLIQQFAALRIHSGSASLSWTRDPENIYTIHVEVPGNTYGWFGRGLIMGSPLLNTYPAGEPAFELPKAHPACRPAQVQRERGIGLQHSVSGHLSNIAQYDALRRETVVARGSEPRAKPKLRRANLGF